MTHEEFELLVLEGIKAIPEKFQKLMSNVAITVEDEARAEQGREVGIRRGHILLGLYEGVPQTTRGIHYSMVPPDKITIFKNSIEQLGGTPEGIKKLVEETVWHEVGHHFGLTDEQIHKAEKRRKNIS